MAATVKTWVNNSPPQVEDADLNGFKLENSNLIVGGGEALSDADNQQTHKAVSAYAAGGAFYTDSGAADAHVLDTVGAKVAPPAYFDGFEAIFRAGNTNTGATTVNVATLGVKNIFFGGVALVGGEIVAGAVVTLIYDLANDRFNMIMELAKLYSNGTIIGIGAVPDLGAGLHIKNGDSGAASVSAAADGLVIEGSGDSGITILSGNTSVGRLFFGDDGVGGAGRMEYDHSTDSMSWSTTSTPRMKLDLGLYMDGATGGDQGADTINASAYYIDGVLQPPSGIFLQPPINTTSGISHSFSSIPSGVKRINCLFSQISTDGNGELRIQIGDSGGLETAEYRGTVANIDGTETTDSTSSGFIVKPEQDAATQVSGMMVLSLLDASTNTWVMSVSVGDVTGTNAAGTGGYRKALTGELTQLTLNNTLGDTFDNGIFNVSWEF